MSVDVYIAATNKVIGVDFTAGTAISTPDLGATLGTISVQGLVLLSDGVLALGDNIDPTTHRPALKIALDLASWALWGDAAAASIGIYEGGWDPSTGKVALSGPNHWSVGGADGFAHVYDSAGAHQGVLWPYPTYTHGGYSNVQGSGGGGKYYVEWQTAATPSAIEGLDAFDLTTLAKTVLVAGGHPDNVTALNDGRIAAIPGAGASPTVATFYHSDGSVEHTVSIAQPAGESFTGYFAARSDGSQVYFATTDNATGGVLTAWAVDATTGAVLHSVQVPASIFNPNDVSTYVNNSPWPYGMAAPYISPAPPPKPVFNLPDNALLAEVTSGVTHRHSAILAGS